MASKPPKGHALALKSNSSPPPTGLVAFLSADFKSAPLPIHRVTGQFVLATMVSFCQSYLWAKRTPFFAFPACAVASEIIRIKEQVRSSGLLHGSSVLGLGLTILALAPHSGVLGISCRILSTSLASRLGLLHICATHPCLAMGRLTGA